MSRLDHFDGLARYYDQLMDHVDYDRWFFIAGGLASLLHDDFVHIDVACGTGMLVKELRKIGWRSVGADLSPAMIAAGRRHKVFPAVVADATALPFHGSADYVTCLFDSLNFLLTLPALKQAFCQVHDALRPGGLFYCDVVTERMVLEHFDGQTWVEESGRLSTSWSSRYDPTSAIAETTIQVNRGPGYVIRERVYPQAEIEDALREAGFTPLGMVDAETWGPVRRKTLRIDMIAVKGTGDEQKKAFRKFAGKVSRWLKR